MVCAAARSMRNPLQCRVVEHAWNLLVQHVGRAAYSKPIFARRNGLQQACLAFKESLMSSRKLIHTASIAALAFGLSQVAVAQSTPSTTPSTSPSTKSTTQSTGTTAPRSEEHTSELQSRLHLVCRLLLE